MITWENAHRIDFEFEGKKAILICPEVPNKSKNWLLKTEYFSAFQDFEKEMVKRGWHLAYIENSTRWCAKEDLERKKRFIDYLLKEFELNPKCVPVGMSCGGMIAVKLAAKYPQYISSLYLDAPVMNLLSCPAGLGKATDVDGFMEDFTKGTGMDMCDLISYRNHPIDNVPILVDNNIPVIMVFGDSDTVVPYEENGALLQKYYNENGGVLTVIEKKNCGHHPHGLEDNTPIVEFVEKYS